MKHKKSVISIAMAALVLVSLYTVCASASVMAADNGKATAQAPSLVGAGLPGGASVCTQEGKSLDIFAKANDNSLWWKHYDYNTKVWSAWKSLGGSLTSDPAAVSTSPGTMDVYVRGTDGAIWWKDTTNGGTSWSNWYSIGGKLLAGTGPAVAQYYPSRIFATGADHGLWSYQTSAHSWQSYGGYATSSPTATTDDYTGNFYAYVRGSDNALWECYIPLAKWTSIGGQLLAGTNPAASDVFYGRAVFVTGADHAIWWMSWYESVRSGWKSLGGYVTSSPAATYRPLTTSVYTVDVFARGSEGALWWRSGTTPNSPSYTWTRWTSIGGM